MMAVQKIFIWLTTFATILSARRLIDTAYCTSCDLDDDCAEGCLCTTLGSAFGVNVQECRGSCCTNPDVDVDIDLATTPYCASCESNSDCAGECVCETLGSAFGINVKECRGSCCTNPDVDIDIDLATTPYCTSCNTDSDCTGECLCETLGSAFGIDIKECRGSCCVNPDVDIDLATTPYCASCDLDDDCEGECSCETLGSAFGMDIKECRGSCCVNPDIDLATTQYCTSCSADNDCGEGCGCTTLGSAFGIDVKECRGTCCVNPDVDVDIAQIETTAIATFVASESDGVDGTVTVDENGNVFINLDLTNFNNENSCNDATYSIYNGEICTDNIIGEVFNPFNTQSCSQYTGDGDKYFECSIGDLSARFGNAWLNGARQVILSGNISEQENDREGGFCVSRLTPEALYKRSIVFRCNDEKKNILFCAPFQIEKTGGTEKCKQLGEACETREDCCDSECVDLKRDGRKKC